MKASETVHPKGIQKIIAILTTNPSAYIIDYCEGDEFDLIKSDDIGDVVSVSKNQFWYLRDNSLIEWQKDTERWGDRYRLTGE